MGIVEGGPVRADVERGTSVIAEEVSVPRRLRDWIIYCSGPRFYGVESWNSESRDL